MEQQGRPVEPPPWLPVARPPVPPEPPPPTRRFDWRRLRTSPRVAVGLGALAAALLLWPFAGFSWIPWLVGLGALLILRLLRLDGLLRGWDVPLAAVAVVAGLMVSTGPWAWAFAASIGVLLAGLVQLPRWRVAAVGAVLCLVTGVGFGFANLQEERAADEAYRQVQAESKADQGAPRPQGVLPILLNRIALGSPGAVCDSLLTVPARDAFVAASGQPDCLAAVAALTAQVTNRDAYARATAPSQPAGKGLQVDACRLDWGRAGTAGPQLGGLTVGEASPGRYLVTGFSPCSTTGR